MILLMVSDTPESRGLPSVQKLAGEKPQKADSMPIKELQKKVVRHPGIWIIALSSAFVYITQHAVSEWGVLFLQKGKGFSLAGATQIIAFSEAFGIAGTVLAGWLSDKVFKGNRFIPVLISGLLCLLSLGAFLFTGGGYSLNIIYVSVFSLAIGVVYCTVAGLMALDIVPRHRGGSWNGRSGQLCRRRNPEHRQRYNDRRERFQFRPRLRLLDCRLPPQFPDPGSFLEISTSAVG